MTTRPVTRSLRALAAAALVLAVAAGAVLTAPLTATAAPVVLSGIVTGPTGAGLAAVPISVLAVASDGALSPAGAVNSSTTGTFALPPLPAGQYTLRFGATTTTYAQYLGKTSAPAEAQVLDFVDAAGGTPWISANLAAGGIIRGAVKTTAGKPVAKYTATAYNPAGDAIAKATTSPTGAYSFASLEPGAYRIGVEDAVSPTPVFAPVFSGPAATLGQARAVSVSSGLVSTQNFTLGAAGRISGMLRGDCLDTVCPTGTTNEVLSGVTVTPYRVSFIDGAYVAERLSSLSRTSTAAGAFVLTGLAPGSYVLRLSPLGASSHSGTAYGERFLGGADSATSAKKFTIAAATVITGVSDILTPSSTISATFLDATAQPVANLEVSLSLYSDQQRRMITEAFTDSSGTVSLVGAATGLYRLSYGTHVDSNPADTITENTTFEGGESAVFSYAGDSVTAAQTVLALKNPLGLQPLSTLTISTTDPTVGGVAGIAGGLYFWNSTNVTPTVQWLRNGEIIPGATNSIYTFRGADAGSQISARITGRNLAYGSGAVVTAATPFIGEGTMYQSKSQQLTGSTTVGGVATLIPAEYYTPGAVSTITWQRVNSVGTTQDIAGETSTHHVLTAEDLVYDDNGLSRIRAKVTVTRQGYAHQLYWLDSSIITEGTLTQTKTASITASPSTFTAKAPIVAPAPATTDFIWTVYDAAGAPATTVFGASFARAGTAGKKITVTVRTQRAGYTPRLVVLVAQNAPAPAVSGSVAITGTPVVDGTLAAPQLVFAPALDKAPGYQWSYLSGTTWKKITGAASPTFVPTAAYKGLRLRVVVTGASTGYLPRIVTSTATPPVIAGSALTLVTAPTLSGAAQFNRTITATTGTWTPGPTSVGYQWKVSTNGTTFIPIAGAVKASYTIPSTALGKSYAVTVTAARAGYASAATTVLAGTVTTGQIKNLTAPKFAEKTPGQFTVTSNGTWANPVTDYSYRWLYADPQTGQIITSPIFYSSSIAPETFDGSIIASVQLYLVVRANGLGGATGDSAPILIRKGTLSSTGAWVNTGPNGSGVGATLTSPPVTWKTPGASTKSTQWQVSSSTDAVPPLSSWTNISGATKSTFALTPAYENKKVRVRVTGQATGYVDTAVYSSAQDIYSGAQFYPSGETAEQILGARRVGNTLTFQQAKFPVGWTASHEWFRFDSNGAVSVGTGKTYTPNTTDLLYVHVSATRPGYTAVSYNTNPLVIGFGVTMPTVQPVVTKSALGVYSVTSGTYAPAASQVSYLWSVTSETGVETPLYGGGPSFTPPAIHDGKLLTVRMTVTSANPLYPAITVTKVARAAATSIEWTSEPYFNGSQDVGQTLTAAGGSWTMPSPTLSYIWKRSGAVIAGVTGASYSPVAADIGKLITVTVTASRPNLGSAVKVITASFVTLSDVQLQPVTGPSASGTAAVGGALQASPGTWSVPGLTFAYQWTRNASPIAGATASSYTLSSADLGQDVAVVVTAGKANYYRSTEATSSAIYVKAGTFGSIGTVVITTPSNLLVAGKPISAALAGWPKNATLTYQWEHSADGSNCLPISGATGKTFTATAATAGYTRLTVTASAPGYTTQSVSTLVFRINL